MKIKKLTTQLLIELSRFFHINRFTIIRVNLGKDSKILTKMQ